ncbi:MAG: potassium channel protein [Leptolyngbya sp. DLM2.Bin15]|nr:MAG: potassium channel protein [Leptolyngbya sp. DLM2.Bin15]
MQGSFQRILTGAIFFSITLIVAIFGYTLFGWSLLDAIYMVVITIFGVGYGEVKPLDTPTQKIFTMAVIIAGTSSAVYIVGGFLQMVTEGEINRALDDRRKQKSIDRLKDHVIICGFGRIGQVLARHLADAEHPFVVIDCAPQPIEQAEALDYLTYSGNATDEDVLNAVGINRAKVLATVLSDDALNVFITLTARELNQNLVILARGEVPSTEKKLRLAGADHVVLPATISALRMSHLITRPTTTDFLTEKDERSYINDLLAQIHVQMAELAVPEGSPMVRRTIKEVEVRGKGTFIIVALRRANGELVLQPEAGLMLAAGDALVILGHEGDIPQFAQTYELDRQKLRYRGAKVEG